MSFQRSILVTLWVGCFALLLGSGARRADGAHVSKGRIVVLMVIDGLRPDLVNPPSTPNLSALMHEGVTLERHHSIFPTLTMVNAAVLATGATPGATGILGDSMYLAPVLDLGKAASIVQLQGIIQKPIDLESSHYLAALNGPKAFAGRLMGVEGLVEELEKNGAYTAVVGKQGPTFMFDDRMTDDPSLVPTGDYLFLADDMVAPPAMNFLLAQEPPARRGDLSSIAARDAWFADVVVAHALPAARRASERGKPSLLVFWQHNVDFAQHLAGLGTRPAMDALGAVDANVGKIRNALTKLGIANRTDVIVVSDHGFATVRMQVSLRDLLVEAGIKQAADSKDITVVDDGGNDLVYLSRSQFSTEESRRTTLVRIVDFAEAQEWCGPIFSRRPASDSAPLERKDYLGWIPGTFNQAALGLYNADRSPDLVVSFRELPNVNNRGLTGPENPAFVLGAHGQHAVQNHSYRLVRPIEGVVYSDTESGHFTTGMGMHGAAGLRELHNFGAAAGPDFRRDYVDRDPTSNADIAPTIREILDQPNPAGSSGRVMAEALRRGRHNGGVPRQSTETSYLMLQGAEVITTLTATQFEGRDYLDDASVKRNPLGGAP